MSSDNFAGFFVTTSSQQVDFAGHGGGHWIIDTQLFAGQPGLSFKRIGPTPVPGPRPGPGPGPRPGIDVGAGGFGVGTGGVRVRRSLQITLSNARYPGTTVPADLSVLITQVDTDADTELTVHLDLTFGNASFDWQDSDFGDWLDNLQPATAPISVTGPVVKFNGGGELDFGPAAAATLALRPASLTIQGQDVCALNAFAITATGTSLSLALLSPNPETIVTMEAAAPMSLPLQSPTPIGTLIPQAAFSTLTVHTSETAQGATFSAGRLVTEYVLELLEGLTDLDGAPLQFQLAGGVVNFDLTVTPPRIALNTRGTTIASLAFAGGLGLSMPHSVDSPAALSLAMSFDGQSWTVQQATLPLPGLFVPLDDGIAEPGTSSGASLSLVRSGPNWVALGPLPTGVARVHIENFVLHITRPTDLLSLELSATNMALEAVAGSPPTLGPVPNGQFTFWGVSFPAQHIAERTFYRGSEQPELAQQADDALPPPPVDARMAGPTQLTFFVPPDVPGFPVTLANLLDWRRYQQAGTILDNPDAPYGPPAALQPPDRTRQTAIELPYRLFLSLDEASGWSHATTTPPADLSELWHTRLATRKSSGPGQFVIDERPSSGSRQGRAFWSPDLNTPSDPFTSSLKARQRQQIVRLTSGGELFSHTFDVEEMMLTALGATAHIDSGWNPPLQSGLDLTVWQQVSSFGRDQYVRVGARGVLAPYGHRATRVTVSERRFIAPADGAQATAYLVQFDYIIVSQPRRSYAGLDLPFTEIEFVTRITPQLNNPQLIGAANAFWIFANSAPFLFDLTAVDHLGRRVAFRAPAIFVEDDAGFNASVDAALGEYRQNSTFNAPIDFGRQKIAFAPSVDPENTSFESATLSFDSADQRAPGTGDWQDSQGNSLFRPGVREASIHHVAATALAGAPETVRVSYFPGYTSQSGLPSAAAADGGVDVFLTLLDNPNAALGADKTGVATPAYALTAISKTFGAVPGNPADILQRSVDPSAFLGNAATFLGNIPLAGLIQRTDQIPNLKTTINTAPNGTPISTVTTFEWHPPLNGPPPLGPLVLTFNTPNQPLDLTAKVTTQLSTPPIPPVSELRGTTKGFTLEFASLVALHFDSMTFETVTGKKPSIDVQLNTALPVEFLNDLAFVNALRDYIPSNGFSPSNPAPAAGLVSAALPAASGPFLDVTPSGITAGYSLAIPSVGVGIFSLENISLGAALTLPFEAKPVTLDFFFSERDHKFLLTVDLLAGGGYLALSLDASGVQRLEFAIEFGANVALNLFVATGSAHVLAGASLMFSPTSNSLTGYLRAGGELTVLGLMSIAIDFYLGLSYQIDTGELYGIATLSVEVSVAFISKSVKLTLERRFPGSLGGTQTPALGAALAAQPVGAAALGDLLSEADWSAYAAAFA